MKSIHSAQKYQLWYYNLFQSQLYTSLCAILQKTTYKEPHTEGNTFTKTESVDVYVLWHNIDYFGKYRSLISRTKEVKAEIVLEIHPSYC